MGIPWLGSPPAPHALMGRSSGSLAQSQLSPRPSHPTRHSLISVLTAVSPERVFPRPRTQNPGQKLPKNRRNRLGALNLKGSGLAAPCPSASLHFLVDPKLYSRKACPPGLWTLGPGCSLCLPALCLDICPEQM